MEKALKVTLAQACILNENLHTPSHFILTLAHQEKKKPLL